MCPWLFKAIVLGFSLLTLSKTESLIMNIVTEYGIILGYTPLVLYRFLPLARHLQTHPTVPHGPLGARRWMAWNLFLCAPLVRDLLLLSGSTTEWGWMTPLHSWLSRDSVRSGCYQCSTKCAHEQAQPQETVHYNFSCTWLVYVSINRETFPDSTKQH